MSLKFEKKRTKDSTLAVRLNKETIKRLESLAKYYNLSRASVIEQLIEKTYAEFNKSKPAKNRA